MPRATKRTHGTRYCYIAGCKRPECVAAHKLYMRAYRAERSKRKKEIPHGSDDGYVNWGCRCKRCKAGHTARQRWLRGRASGRAA